MLGTSFATFRRTCPRNSAWPSARRSITWALRTVFGDAGCWRFAPVRCVTTHRLLYEEDVIAAVASYLERGSYVLPVGVDIIATSAEGRWTLHIEAKGEGSSKVAVRRRAAARYPRSSRRSSWRATADPVRHSRAGVSRHSRAGGNPGALTARTPRCRLGPRDDNMRTHRILEPPIPHVPLKRRPHVLLERDAPALR
jgi:hypothetical protein